MSRQLIILLVVLALLGGGIYYHQTTYQQTKQDESTLDVNASTLWLPDLSTGQQVSEIMIEKNGQTLAKFVNQNDQWLAYHLSQAHGIAVDNSRLFSFVRDLSSAKVIDEKSANPKNHERLGLDFGELNSRSTLVSIIAGGKSTKVLIGDKPQRQQGHFVRFADNDQMLLVDKPFVLPTSKSDWLVKDMLPVDTDNLISLTRINEEEVLWTLNSKVPSSSDNTDPLAKPDDLVFEGTNFVLADLSEEESLAYPMVVANYVSTLANLSFEDIQEYEQSIWDEAEQSASLLIRATINDRVQTLGLRLAKKNEAYWVHVKSANNNEATTDIATGDEQIANLSNWIFEIAEFRAQGLLKDRIDFLETKKQAVPTEP
jgi:hypothetical protein